MLANLLWLEDTSPGDDLSNECGRSHDEGGIDVPVSQYDGGLDRCRSTDNLGDQSPLFERINLAEDNA